MFQKRNLCFPNHIDLMLGVVERFDVLCSETPFRPLNIKLGPLSNKLFIEVSFFNGPKPSSIICNLHAHISKDRLL